MTTKNIVHREKTGTGGPLSEYESKLFLAGYGVPAAREILARNWPEVLSGAEELGWPVVLKFCSVQAGHKTEMGLVHLGLTDPGALEAAYGDLSAKAVGLGGGYLVQEQLRGSREFVAGLVRDPQFGPCVMFGLGGVLAEALGDVVFRVAPLSRDQALEMVAGIKASRLLGTFRGGPEVDREALADILVALSRIGVERPEVQAVDINPLIIQDGRPVAADALVVRSRPSAVEPEEKPPSMGLDPFVSPQSVAVIGASSTPGKAGHDVVKNILANGFEGGLYLVNPRGGEILGCPVSASIQDLPQDIDLAVIILPAKANPQAIRDCAARGIKAVVLAAGGFAEVDESGVSLQEELERAVKETGIRALGPNTSGHTSTPADFTSSFFPLGRLPRGRISYIAQTGNFATHTMRYIMSAQNYGVARVFGLGNKVDVEESEVLSFLADDPHTEAVFCYLESLKNPRRFLASASRAARKKPVIVLKGGQTHAGARAAVAHTAALATDTRLVEGAFRQAGLVLIEKYTHLILAAKALAMMPLPRSNRVSFLAPSGAMLVCLTDLCTRRLGLEVPAVQEVTRQRLQEISPPYIRMRNPVDIWPAAAVSGVESAYREAIKAVLEDPDIDAVVPVLMMTDETGVPDLEFIVNLARECPEKPIYVTFSGEKKHLDAARDYLEPRGVPTYPHIEEPFEVLSILARCREVMNRG